MNDFKKDFEIRRNIFGLCAIIKSPDSQLPALVNQKLPDIMNQLSLLCKKQHAERLDTLKDNQEALDGEDDFSDDSNDDDEDGIGNEANDQIGEEEEAPDSD